MNADVKILLLHTVHHSSDIYLNKIFTVKFPKKIWCYQNMVLSEYGVNYHFSLVNSQTFSRLFIISSYHKDNKTDF